MNEGISVFSCGVSNQCPKGGDHQWDGEGVDFKSGAGPQLQDLPRDWGMGLWGCYNLLEVWC